MFPLWKVVRQFHPHNKVDPETVFSAKHWQTDSEEFSLVSKNYNRIVSLTGAGKEVEIFNASKTRGGSKWTWALTEHVRVSESFEYLILPFQYCSQLRVDDEQSYFMKIYRIPSGIEQQEVRITPREWKELGLPECGLSASKMSSAHRE